MEYALGVIFALIPISHMEAQNLIEKRFIGFHLNYGEGEKNTFDYTPNGCRILGKLFSPDTSQPKPKASEPTETTIQYSISNIK